LLKLRPTKSDYTTKVFGFTTFGAVYGLVICLAGLCNFAQSGLDFLTHRVFADDPRPVDLGLLVVALGVGVWLVVFVGLEVRKMDGSERGRQGRGDLVRETEGAVEVPMPGSGGYGGTK